MENLRDCWIFYTHRSRYENAWVIVVHSSPGKRFHPLNLRNQHTHNSIYLLKCRNKSTTRRIKFLSFPEKRRKKMNIKIVLSSLSHIHVWCKECKFSLINLIEKITLPCSHFIRELFIFCSPKNITIKKLFHILI